MHPEDRTKLSKIEELKNRLFSKDFQVKIEHRDNFSHSHGREVMDSWVVNENDHSVNNSNFFHNNALFKKFFLYSCIFFVLALLYGFYMFFAGGNTVSNNNIDISVLGSTFTAGGEELPLQIGITNKNTLALDLVDLVIEYPKNSSENISGESERIREALGTIPSGAIRNENVKVVLFGEQGSIMPIKISIEYRVEGSNAIFVKEKIYEVNINSTPIDISVSAPTEVSPNQDILLNVKVTLNASKSTSTILMRVDYPLGFSFVSSTPAPAFGNNVWNLGDIAPGAERNIAIVGKMIDVFDGEEKTFKIWSGSQSNKDKSAIDVVFNSLGHTMAIKKAFIEASFLIGGLKQREYVISNKGAVSGEIRWINNLDTKVNDLQIRARLSGNIVDKRSIKVQSGFYDSISDVIVWEKRYLPELAEVDPGEGGSLYFSFLPLSLISSGSSVLSNPSATVNIFISGKQEISGYETQELKNSDSSVIKIVSDVGFVSKALYFSGPFSNSGPIPPKVGEITSYTVVWSLSNSANNITKGIVRSSLPAWVRFVGPVSPLSEDLTYNPSTQELVWNVGNIAKGTGISSPSREASFRVTFEPSLSQVGTVPIIVNEAVLTGHDDFANVDIRVSKPALSTRLSSDGSFPIGGERVIE